MATFIERLMPQLKVGNTLALAVKAAALRDDAILEIGPGAQPTFRRSEFPNLKVSDYCSTEELRVNHGKLLGVGVLPADTFDEIDYVCADGRLAEKVPEGQRFDLIFSSHNVEHQPDLLSHLMSVEALLKPGGAVAFLVPHKRHTFDLFRHATTTSDVLLAHFAPRAMAARAAFDSQTRTALVPNPSSTAYTAEAPISIGRMAGCLDRFKADLLGTPQPFIDHHNIFTPDSFQLLIVELYLLGLIQLLPGVSSGAVGNTFLIVLESTPRPPDPAQCKHFEDGLEDLRLAYCKRQAFAIQAR